MYFHSSACVKEGQEIEQEARGSALGKRSRFRMRNDELLLAQSLR
jgi:hypothetical protein